MKIIHLLAGIFHYLVFYNFFSVNQVFYFILQYSYFRARESFIFDPYSIKDV